MAEALKDLVAIREEDRRAIAAHERRLQALEDGVQIRVAQITAIAAIVGGSVTVLGQLVLKAITRG